MRAKRLNAFLAQSFYILLLLAILGIDYPPAFLDIHKNEYSLNNKSYGSGNVRTKSEHQRDKVKVHHTVSIGRYHRLMIV
jgi:hypothetical protein